MSGRPSGRQRWLVPTVLLLVVLPVGGAVANALLSSTDRDPRIGRRGSTVVATGPEREAIEPTDPPASFRLVYAVERYDAGGIVRSEEQLTVRRPFDAHVVTVRDGRRSGERVSRFTTLALLTPDGARTLAVPPAPAASDLRGDFVFGDAPATVAEPREQRRVLGRRCQVYRVGTTVITGELRPVGSVRGEHADLCVDGSGTLLEEVWSKNGRVIRRRVATELVERSFPDATFAFADERAIEFGKGNGFSKPVDPSTSVEGVTWRLPEPPPGYTYRGRYVVQPPDIAVFESPLEAEGRAAGSLVQADVWTSGPDYLILTTSLVTDAKALPGEAPNARRVHLDGIGDATAVYDLRGNYVRADFPDARFVRLTGSLALDRLIDLARTLEPVEGSGVEFLPE